MIKKQTSVFENGLIWFGAAVSIAEIMTGTYIAPLGFKSGFSAILIGHIIGCAMLFLAGYIGGKTQKSSMDAVKLSFGNKGALFFAVLNIIQLVGWTAIMIYDGAITANTICSIGTTAWAFIIGVFIAAWILIGIKNLGIINTIAMSALFVLTILLSFEIFKTVAKENVSSNSITFGAAVELSVAMPLSWLPLISDYTKDAKKPLISTAVSAVIYGIVSCWMYIIGMGTAIFTAESDIAQIMVKSGLGVAGLIIVVFSTVTTTFLDAYSAGVSGEAMAKRINGKRLAILVTVIGTLGAIFFPITDITDFLYFIGSVFAPMIAVQVADFYILKKNSRYLKNFLIWLVGFIIYRFLMNFDFIIGSTVLDVIITIILCVLVDFIEGGMKNEKN